MPTAGTQTYRFPPSHISILPLNDHGYVVNLWIQPKRLNLRTSHTLAFLLLCLRALDDV